MTKSDKQVLDHHPLAITCELLHSKASPAQTVTSQHYGRVRPKVYLSIYLYANKSYSIIPSVYWQLVIIMSVYIHDGQV